ncbi:response regulator [Desulfomarina sp.]
MNFLSLKYKLLFFSILLSVILTAVVSVFEINIDIRSYRNNLNAELHHFEQSHRRYLSSKIWAMEYDSIKAFAEDQTTGKFIDIITITDLRGNTIARSRKPDVKGNLIDRQFPLTYFHNNKINLIGRVRVGGYLPGFHEILERRWVEAFIINGVLVTIIFLSSYLLFYRSVLNRLLSIVRFTESESRAESEAGILIPRPAGRADEIILLIDSLNDRTKRINEELAKRTEAEERLKEKNRDLSREIEEKIQAESALKTSQETLLSVLDSIDATIYVSDLNTYEILFVNKCMMKSFGRDLKGEICWEAFRNEEKPCSHCTNKKLVDEAGNPSGVCVWQGKNPVTGRWYMNYDRAIHWNDGRLVKLQIATDITDFKKMEEDLRQSHKMESIGTLTGGIAHDFNNILGIIIGNTELALEDIQAWNPAHKYIQEIKTASFRAREVVKQLLNYSRKSKEELRPIDISPVIRESLKLLRSSMPATLEIRDFIPPSSHAVLADATQIHQVVINLCTNAAQAIIDEKGVIEISLEEVSLSERPDDHSNGLRSGEYLLLKVKDSGVGIDPELQDKIFDPYFTTKEVGKGTGMGLAVVHGILKNHNASIEIESTPDKGTTVCVYFPFSETGTFDDPVNKHKPRAEGHETILFVDDEKSLVDLSERILRKSGYIVAGITDPVQALELFKENPNVFDLIISDMTMPQMTGAEFAEKIKAVRSDIPIIICTGHSSLLNEKKAREIGISAFLMKPVSAETLRTTIRDVIDRVGVVPQVQ